MREQNPTGVGQEQESRRKMETRLREGPHEKREQSPYFQNSTKSENYKSFMVLANCPGKRMGWDSGFTRRISKMFDGGRGIYWVYDYRGTTDPV